MKGRWLPVKALGTAKDSSGESSFSMSSKLLVSTSLDNSGMTGGTAEIKYSNQSKTSLSQIKHSNQSEAGLRSNTDFLMFKSTP